MTMPHGMLYPENPLAPYVCPGCFKQHNDWEGKGDIPELKGERVCTQCLAINIRVRKHLQYLMIVTDMKNHPIFGGVYNAKQQEEEEH